MNLKPYLLLLPLVGCMDPPPPCPDEACVLQRQANAMMILSIMANQPQIQPYQLPEPISTNPPMSTQNQLDDLRGQLQLQQDQISIMHRNLNQ